MYDREIIDLIEKYWIASIYDIYAELPNISKEDIDKSLIRLSSSGRIYQIDGEHYAIDP